MLYVRVLLIFAVVLVARVAAAEPREYQHCVTDHFDHFRQDETKASSELLASLGELKGFPDMQEDAKKSYEFGLSLRKAHFYLGAKISESLCRN